MYIRNQTRSSVTVIDNRFIDEYMTIASGEFVKVYLYLLRMAQDSGRECSIAALADGLELTEKDVLRGLRYWEKQGLLAIESAGDSEIEGVQILPIPGTSDEEEAGSVSAVQGENLSASPQAAETAANPAPRAARARVQEIPAEAIDELQAKEEFREIVMVSEMYLGRTLTPKDIQLFAYLYDELHFPKDLLEYLVEYCVDGGHKSNRYMETVALNWHQEGKMTVELARSSQKAYSRENKVVMKAFGIVNRVLNPEERTYVEKWTQTYGMPLEVVEEACNITMSSIQKASFPYTDKILTDWHEAGVHTLAEAKAHRENRRNGRGAQQETGNSVRSNPTAEKNGGRNRFQNYQQRNIDYDSLIQQGGWNPYGSDHHT